MPHAVDRLTNDPVDSNCYLIRDVQSRRAVLIDPAVWMGEHLQQSLSADGITVDFILLTHEHFDHISSTELIRKVHGCPVVATAACSEAITDSKKNLSLFHDGVGFQCAPADRLIYQNGEELAWNGSAFTFYLTPGHSVGGMSIRFESGLFTGDTWMENTASPTKLPGGSKALLAESTALLKSLVQPETIIYPGHGLPFKTTPLLAASFQL